MTEKNHRQYRSDILALVAYLVLAIVLTYPLILHFTTHVAGDGSDDPALAWNLWWVPYSMIHLQSNPIYTQHMFYPIGLDLAFYTLTYLNAFLAIPFQYAFNLVVAANTNLLLSFVLSGFGVYLLTKWLLRDWRLRSVPKELRNRDCEASHRDCEAFRRNWRLVELASFAAGALYAFSSNKLLYASLGQFNIASSHWIPFYVLFLLKLTRPGITNHQLPITNYPLRISLLYGFLLGLFLLFQALSEFIFASFLIIFTAIYLVYLLLRRWRQITNYQLLITNYRLLITNYHLLISFLVAALTFTIPMLPILTAMIKDTLAEGDFIQSGLGFADVFSNDVLGFFIPSHLHPLLGGLDAQFHFAYTNFAYLGFAALALALIAVWKISQARIWAVFGGIFILITLGPDLRIDGNAIPAPFLPFNWLLQIPFVKGNRYPSRWSVMVTLALAVLVGYGLLWLLEKLQSRKQKAQGRNLLPSAAFCLALSAILFEHLSAPLPLSNFQIPSVYQTIAQDKGDFSVLEIPLAWRNGFRMTGTLDAEMMFEQWYQTEHQHPILGGNTSRNPELKFQYFTEAPVINSLIAVETGHALNESTIEGDRQLAPEVLRFFGVRYVVWHSPRNEQNRAALDAARAYVERVFPMTKFYDMVDDTGQTIAYRVNEPAPSIANTIYTVSRLNLAEGWGTVGEPVVWATRRQAQVFWRMDNPRDATLTIRALASLPGQTLRVLINGRDAGLAEMQTDWRDYTFRVPANLWRAGMNEIVLQFSALAPVARQGNYMIDDTEFTSTASIVARSAGSETGDFAHIYVDGIDAAQNTRGYNIVVVDANKGTVEASAAFDTFASEAESTRLAQFIALIPKGKIVAVAVRDEASRDLTEEAVDALRSIGASVNLHGKWRWSHAIIGVKGAPSGIALESASEIAPSQLVVGMGAMEPNVAAAVAQIEIK